jgi:phenylacetate-CoA ligase
MSFTLKRRFYESLPLFLKKPIVCVPFSYWAGKAYREVWGKGQNIDRGDRNCIRAYQEVALGEIMKYACQHIPAYAALQPVVNRLKPFEALKAFPLLDKNDLQKRMKDYLPRHFARIPHYDCTTGGTTGNQLTFYVDDHSQSVEMAFMHRQWARVGYTTRNKKATFRGVEFRNLPPRVYWQDNPIYNEVQFSPFHINDSTLPKYWEKLLEFGPKYIHGYPSAIMLLADFANRYYLNASALKLHAILCGSEALLPGQREFIQEVFKARVYSWYGHSERLILAGECECCSAYHQFPDYGILEILDDNGESVSSGDTGEIVGTGLINRSLPLIRYRTGDRARLLDWKCDCGRAFDRFDSVEGRWQQEFLFGRNGSSISLAALNMHGKQFEHIRRYQYYQSTPGLVELRVMVNDGFDDKCAQSLISSYRDKVGSELDVQLRIVEDIPLTRRGKLRRLIRENTQFLGNDDSMVSQTG